MAIKDETVIFPLGVGDNIERVALDHVTVARLLEICEEAHASPAAMIAAIITDVMRDDFEMEHSPPGYSPEKPLH